MLHARRRKTVLAAAALVATTMLLTACQGEDADGGDKSAGTTASDPAAKGKSDGGGNGTGTGTGSQPGAKGSKSGMVSGKWVGTVSYLAPGKYTVTDAGDVQQAFFTSEDTDIEGAGKICGDADGQAATPCTEEELEAAAKKGFGATVDVKDGVAVSIIEDHTDSGNGGGNGMGEGERSGLFSGTLGYMAPGKYSLSRDGSERAFFTATDTEINGAGWICGDADGQATTPCTEEDLEAAAKKGGIAVAVQVEDGIAVTIDEEHN
ncbi:hypothetical protein C4J65_12595 [Streptomyces sp. CB09001]|uniref:hypothetical protein n=1 Tax=Streptomyces sp. CB09001 TaxID=2083284 RepID=UPI000E21806E|nr:hypothetical protein [Streptomyces sp. CB09001]AXL89055.1 hypothetical protein C4J65_12595 [Streptomyces sp. CB09001]